MIKKIINRISDRLEDRIRSIVKPLSPDARVIVILVLLLLFSAGSIYMTVSSIYNIGKKSAQQQIRIEQIKRLELKDTQKTDSIN